MKRMQGWRVVWPRNHTEENTDEGKEGLEEGYGRKAQGWREGKLATCGPRKKRNDSGGEKVLPLTRCPWGMARKYADQGEKRRQAGSMQSQEKEFYRKKERRLEFMTVIVSSK